MRIPLIDLRAQHAAIADELMAAVAKVVAEQSFILGARVAAFEQRLAEYVGVRHAVGVASCTDALRLALVALGIGPGDAVITTPFTFVASAEAIVRAGATPVFVDVDADSVHLSPERVAECIREWRGPERLRAILVVHLFGACADSKGLLELARTHGLFLVEDAAQALGAVRDGAAAGAVGHASAFSFFPAKTLGAWGDGGALVTADDAIAARVRRLRQHGVEGGRVMEIGENSRLDALHAAVLEVKLRHLEAWIAARRQGARRYRELLDGVPGVSFFDALDEGGTHNPYVVRIAEGRDRVLMSLRAQGIDARAYYDRPIPDEPAFASVRHHRAAIPEAEKRSRDALALPLCANLSTTAQQEVVDALRSAMAGR
ncbi:DegT/DnrJ/EryC1/StrS family aminotransferase [Pendulispora brunnea]|uniref:DegT/DnrJ/EryC1/StrS family aminotransferase n=1 Tax=Pendulispora brunnea TaxID=2905690 RepID=A0ABZ2KN51_9BACT